MLRLAVTVLVLACALATMVVVMGIAFELVAPQGAADQADLRIVSGGGETSPTAVIDVESPRLSDAHDRHDSIVAHDGVVSATPVLTEVVMMRAGGEPVYVLAVGVIPGEETPSIVGVPTADLEPGDPHFANGSYDGPRTGDVVLSESAGTQVNATEGDEIGILPPGSLEVEDSHTVTRVEESDGDLAAQLPVAVFRLSELQTITGADRNDLADQIAVRTEGDDASVRADLEETNPNATVLADDGIGSSLAALERDDRALALAATTTALGVGLGALIVTTTMGLVVERDRRTLATLDALGYTERERLSMVAVTILTLTVAGATLGLVGGMFGVWFANVAASSIGPGVTIATIGPWAVPYVFAVAVVSGLCAIPYPVALARRASTLADLTR